MNILSTTAHNFLQHGHRPATDRERSALLDELRSALADNISAWTPPTDAASLDRIQRSADAAKLQRDRAQADLDARIKAQRARLAAQAATKAKPAAKSAPMPTPHLDQLANLQGRAASSYYKTHSAAIDREQRSLNRKSTN